MLNKLKILHLEDSSIDAELVNRVLINGNFVFERLLVETRESFVAALDEFVPDLILSNHSLPSFNSHEALSIYGERKLQIPFILVASNVSEEFAFDVIKRGAHDYILKDRLERLPNAIHNTLEKFQLEIGKQSYLSELIKNEKHLRTLVEYCGDVLMVLTEEGKPKYVSTSVQRVLGYSEEEALELNLFEILHPDDREATVQRWARALENPGVPFSGHEGRIKNKKGEWVWFEATMTNMLHDPTINGIVDNFRDITERKIARQQLVKTQLFNKNILSSLDAHIAVINQNGLIIAVNKAWDDFAITNGASSASFTSNGSNYFDVCERAASSGIKDAEDALKGLKAVINNESELFKLEYASHSPLEKRWFMLNATKLGGDEASIVVSHQNITDRKLAEENLQKYSDELLISNKGLEQFSYIISHNLRAPVANILGLAQILDHSDPEMHGILVNDLITNASRLDEVIRDLNSILQAKSVLSELKEKVSLKALLEAIQQSIQNVIEQESLSIDLSGIEVDEFYSLKSYMYSIFMNLLTNTIKYRRTDIVSQVEVTSREETGKLIITYRDNGRGIDMTKNGVNIFGLYKRFHLDIEGKGMGLYMVKTQTEILGGKVSVKSEVNKGVEFTFEFPYRNSSYEV